MSPLSWLFCIVCARWTYSYSFFGGISRESVSFFPLEEDVVKSWHLWSRWGFCQGTLQGFRTGWNYNPVLLDASCRCPSERDWLKQVYQVSKGHHRHQVCWKSDLYQCISWESWKWPGWLMWCFRKAQQLIFKMTEWLRFTDHLSPFTCPQKWKYF